MLGRVRGASALLPVTVRGPSGIELRVGVQVDTGFSDFLTLPPDFIAALGLAFDTKMPMTMADEHERWVDAYTGVIVWEGVEQEIPIQELESALLAMAMLADHRLVIDAVEGGQVSIQPLP